MRRPRIWAPPSELYLGGQPDRVQHHHRGLHPQGHPLRPPHLGGVPPAARAALAGVRSGESPAPRAAEDAAAGRRWRRSHARGRSSTTSSTWSAAPCERRDPSYVEGRQNPTMTYLSRTQVNAVNNYLEFGWIWDVPRAAHPQDAPRRLRRDRVPHRQRPGPSRRPRRRYSSSASATSCSSSTPPIAPTSPGGWTTVPSSGKRCAGRSSRWL